MKTTLRNWDQKVLEVNLGAEVSNVRAVAHGLTRVDEHVLFKVLDSCKADATCGALEWPFRPIESRACGRTDVQVVRVLNVFQPTGKNRTEQKNKRGERKHKMPMK